MLEKIGIGIDIVDVKKFNNLRYSSNPNIYKKIFSVAEISYCLKFKNSPIHFAGKFAIKEATIKAINKKIALINIETSHSNSKPQIKIHHMKNQYHFISSLSHEKNFAIAVVISEKI